MKLRHSKLRKIVKEEIQNVLNEAGGLDPRMPTGRGPHEYQLYQVHEDLFFDSSSPIEVALNQGESFGKPFKISYQDSSEQKEKIAQRKLGTEVKWIDDQSISDTRGVGGYFRSKFQPGYVLVPVRSNA